MAWIPASMRSMGSCMPITPVEATSTLSSGTSRAAAQAPAVWPQYSMPSFPVQALAMPALTTTALAAAPPYTWFLSHLTGAACTRLVVKVPADTQSASL